MITCRNSITVSVFRPTVAVASTGDRTITYPNAATATLRGQLVKAIIERPLEIGGYSFATGYWLYLPAGTDVRPLERSDYEESAPDRLQINGRNYLCIKAETMFGMGNPIRAWLIRERD